MKQELATINGHDLAVKEIDGKRVVSIRQIADIHGISIDTVRNSFKRNRKHFLLQEDYYQTKEKSAVRDEMSHASKGRHIGLEHNANYFTESGYLLLVKSLTDDTAWKVQRELINSYFRGQQAVAATKSEPLPDLKIAQPERDLRHLVMILDPVRRQIVFYRNLGLTQEETAKLLDLTPNAIKQFEVHLREMGFTTPNQNGRRSELNSISGIDRKLQIGFGGSA